MNAIVEDLVQRHPNLWRGAGHVQHQGPASVPTGHARLDAQLPGGGWPPGCITELMVRALGTGEWRLLAPALQRLAQSGRHILLLAPPHIPHAPALAALGLPTEQFLVVRARHAADRLWALEQSLRSNRFGALIAWLDATTKPEALRRFQLAARNAQGPVFLFRPFEAQTQPSPAPLRLALLPRHYPGLAVQLLKRRGPVSVEPILVNVPMASRALRPLEEAHALDRLPIPERQPLLRPHTAPVRTAASH